MEIKAIIFDFGGVLIDDPWQGMVTYCAHALSVDIASYTKVLHKFHGDFQRGKISEDVFWENICSQLNVSKPKINSLWQQSVRATFKPKPDMLQLVDRLRSDSYKVALLSNTEVPVTEFFPESGYNIFDVTVFSCAEGVRKPERKIYELLLERLGTTAGESVFIDDVEEYINGAEKAGLNTILFKSEEQVKHELSQLGVKID